MRSWAVSQTDSKRSIGNVRALRVGGLPAEFEGADDARERGHELPCSDRHFFRNFAPRLVYSMETGGTKCCALSRS